uniref:Ig-like domain-containing protein n=1 Tax=Fundulus heteroclitus TaxID=8078 RepID=A0A3Q2NMJ3_FUNHE
ISYLSALPKLPKPTPSVFVLALCLIDATGYGPIFEEEPMDVVYTSDSPEKRISMNCRARANPPATYRWRRDNWEIKLMEQPDEHYSLVGGNLVITNPIQKKHAGTYTCVTL